MIPRLAAFAFALALPWAACAAPFAYVPNEGSGTLSVIDTATDKVVAEIAAGTKPRGTVVGVDGRRAYVSDQPNNQLVMIDLDLRKVAGTIPLGAEVVLELLPPGGAAPMPITGRVAYHAGDNGTGLKFIYRDGGGSRRIRELIRRIRAS